MAAELTSLSTEFISYADLSQEQLQAVARFMAERLKTGSAGVVPGTLKTLTDQGRDYAFVLLEEDCEVVPSVRTVLRA